ncbi:hypothetical protein CHINAEXTREME_17285 [Halobiforma lacisalsi AJ5]|uniref:SWIM-type domain-containing protein n=1 Tax=Natronobacterium lacisalsi AJ5 TaxID=358396 RepID=M0LP07_NATLA|nr:SWIM zinc finger family protein [Halobiforma lacisalsi]APW99415.1 hypothetical protein CHINAEXTREME_17285 [Halobiforma lacisalsi AJ5]EMA35282.1 hypothetical protein C445_05498 [Halobiforma lacisalsi AJ5]
MSAFPEPTDGEAVDFLEERDGETESWTRADPREALIESFGRFGYKVTLRDGEDVHYCALGIDDGEYVGRCDCKGWQYHDGPCAHLCTLRKADFLELIAVEATDGSPDDEIEMRQSTGETFDGEHHDDAIERSREHEQEREVRA